MVLLSLIYICVYIPSGNADSLNFTCCQEQVDDVDKQTCCCWIPELLLSSSNERQTSSKLQDEISRTKLCTLRGSVNERTAAYLRLGMLYEQELIEARQRSSSSLQGLSRIKYCYMKALDGVKVMRSWRNQALLGLRSAYALESFGSDSFGERFYNEMIEVEYSSVEEPLANQSLFLEETKPRRVEIDSHFHADSTPQSTYLPPTCEDLGRLISGQSSLYQHYHSLYHDRSPFSSNTVASYEAYHVTLQQLWKMCEQDSFDPEIDGNIDLLQILGKMYSGHFPDKNISWPQDRPIHVLYDDVHSNYGVFFETVEGLIAMLRYLGIPCKVVLTLNINDLVSLSFTLYYFCRLHYKGGFKSDGSKSVTVHNSICD